MITSINASIRVPQFNKVKFEESITYLHVILKSAFPAARLSEQPARMCSPILSQQSRFAEYCMGCGMKAENFLRTTRMIYLQNCLHPFCSICINKQVRKDYTVNDGQLKCKKCAVAMSDQDYKEAMGKEKFDSLVSTVVQEKFHLIKCVECNNMFKNVDDNSQMVVCTFCQKEQCRSCKVTPYHTGFDCKTYQAKKKVCRYCGTVGDDQCLSAECVAKAKVSCSKLLPCGHECMGYVNEKKCLPCRLCSTVIDYNEYCVICQVDMLKQGPCIQSQCGHVFHYTCIVTAIQMKYPGPDITFNYCQCGLCKRWLQFEKGSDPQKLVDAGKHMRDKIKRMAYTHFKVDNGQKQLVQLQDEDQLQEIALTLYSYYMCVKCQNPYFGGTKECQQQLEEIQPEEQICPECALRATCKRHGNDFIIHKCRFCCNKAIYFCWGTTHFCESCHQKQINKDYLNRKSRDKLPKCLGSAQCPIGGNHRPNGEEQALGCALCDEKL